MGARIKQPAREKTCVPLGINAFMRLRNADATVVASFVPAIIENIEPDFSNIFSDRFMEALLEVTGDQPVRGLEPEDLDVKYCGDRYFARWLGWE
jgi:hypothetical protein